MHLIVGLGNPGDKYARTRHNAGFWFLDALLTMSAARLRAQGRQQAEYCRVNLYGHDCLLARPTSFMNHSGQAVRALVDYYGISMSSLLIAYDELDLPPGVARLKQGGGHGGHNGLRDICRHLGEPGFDRIRIGIGHPGHKDAVTGYVLGKPKTEDRLLINESIEQAVEVLPLWLDGKAQQAMTRLHTQAP